MKSLAQQYKRCIYEAILKAIRKPHKCPSSTTSKNNQFQAKFKNTLFSWTSNCSKLKQAQVNFFPHLAEKRNKQNFIFTHREFPKNAPRIQAA